MYKKRGRKLVKPNKEIFEMLYYNEAMTAKQIADFYRVKISTVYKWASEFRKEKTS